MRWMQVAVRPAKPFAFGVLGASGVPVFGLPGNPVSSLVSFELFARPASAAAGGPRRPDPARGRERWRRSTSSARPTASCTSSRRSRPRRSTAPCRSGPRVARARTASARWPTPTPWRTCPTGDGPRRPATGRGLVAPTASDLPGRHVTTVPVSIGARRHPGDEPSAAPLDGPLVDRTAGSTPTCGISVTDRCNFRCVYCMPDDEVAFTAPGRRPVVRRDRPRRRRCCAGSASPRCASPVASRSSGRASSTWSARLADLGFADLSLTTNGILLAALAPGAGRRGPRPGQRELRLPPTRALRRASAAAASWHEVLAGMDAAEAAGLGPVKVNVVLLAGAERRRGPRLRRASPATPGAPSASSSSCRSTPAGHWDRAQVVPGREVHRRIHEAWPLEPRRRPGRSRSGRPATASPTARGRSASSPA